MKNKLFFLKELITATFIMSSICGFSQVQQKPKIENPNAANLGIFGDFPVNMFTGIPDIGIPIYNLNYGKINVPIKLRYSPAAVKPTVQLDS